MENVPPNTVNANKPEPDNGKKVKIPGNKVYLLYVVLAVLMIVALKMYLNSAKKGQYFANKPHAYFKKNNGFFIHKRIISAFSFQKNAFLKHEDPKRLKSQNLICNGIVFSPENKFALINNIIVKEGDKLGDVVVLQINADYVELGNNTLRLKLRPYNK